MPLIKKLATLAAAAEVARQYAKKNPDKASRFLDQAAAYLDQQTKGKYSGQIRDAARRAKSAAGIPQSSGPGAPGNGFTAGHGGFGAGYGQGGSHSKTA